MSIDQSEFSYKSNPFLKRTGIKLEYTQEQLEEFIKCSQDPIYFLENYYKINNLDQGLITIQLYDFQKEMIKLFHENRMCVLKMPRQSAKTTSTVGYMLWSSLFNDNYGIAVLANKQKMAQEILDRYQLAYENIPMFLQQGVKKFNESTVELENGSRIIATATSISAIRGFSVNLLFVDEAAWIPNNIMTDFFSSVYPTLSSGKTTKFIMSSTPRGINSFYKIWTDSKAGRNEFIPFEIHWSNVPGRDEEWEKKQRAVLGDQLFSQEYNCAFLGSSNTLVSGEKLACMAYKEPVGYLHDVVLYEQPIKETYDEETGKPVSMDHLYLITVDVSEGKNLDYSAFSVFDISTMPYKQVARYRDNKIAPMLFPSIIKACAEHYNSAYVLVEINNSPQVANILCDDLGYEQVLRVFTGTKRPQMLSMRGGKGVVPGLKMTPLTKRIGCSTLKTLIENDKLILSDFETISEMTTFVQNGPSFKAEEGCNDDLALTLVIFGWAASEKLFKEIVNHDLRKQLQVEHFDFIEEEEMLPVFAPQTGKEVPFFVDEEDVWVYGSISDFINTNFTM